MKAFLIAWVIIQSVLLIVGHTWIWLDWKNEKTNYFFTIFLPTIIASAQASYIGTHKFDGEHQNELYG